MGVDDPRLQAYLQLYPFAHGPDTVLNAHCRRAIGRSLQLRPYSAHPDIKLLSPLETRLPSAVIERVTKLMTNLGITAKRKRRLQNDFEWKVRFVSENFRRGLVLGCGDGLECAYLRGLLPEAELTAVDYLDSLVPDLRKTTGIRFIRGNLREVIHRLRPGFDFIFTNHLLEHLYDPDETIRLFSTLLRPSGILVSGLPLEGAPDFPFASDLRRLVNSAPHLHPLDFDILNAGHPWKTNGGDLLRTLSEHGFPSVRLYQRDGHFSREERGSQKAYRRKRQAILTLNRLVLHLPRTLLKTLFPRGEAQLLLRLFFAVDSRLPFGVSYLKRHFTEEVLVVARTPPRNDV
jgi:SAM-dependent methyltransferase